MGLKEAALDGLKSLQNWVRDELDNDGDMTTSLDFLMARELQTLGYPRTSSGFRLELYQKGWLQLPVATDLRDRLENRVNTRLSYNASRIPSSLAGNEDYIREIIMEFAFHPYHMSTDTTSAKSWLGLACTVHPLHRIPKGVTLSDFTGNITLVTDTMCTEGMLRLKQRQGKEYLYATKLIDPLLDQGSLPQ